MKILFICHEFPPAKRVGGIGIFVKNISNSLVKQGCHVTVIGLYRQAVSTEEVLDNGVRVVRVAGRKQYGLGWWLQRRKLQAEIVRLHRIDTFDIVETSDYDAGFWLIRKLNIPYVVRLNGGEVYFRSLLQEPLRWQHRLREAASIRKADAISSVSEYTWRETKRLFRLRDQEIPILRNPVDTSWFKPNGTPVIKGRILYSGTFIRKKGVLELFQCISSVFDCVAEAHLVCVGADSGDVTTGSPSTKELALSLVDRRHHHRIVFTGRVEHELVLQFIREANVCVYPSYLEAFPNAWIEAMACGKAVIGSTTGSGPEVIRDGETGLLCHPSDHEGLSERIIRILTDDDLCARLGEDARRYATGHWDISAITALNLRWYQSVINRFREG